MAEYIDRNLIEWYGCNFEEPSCKNRECSGCSHAECSHTQVMQIPTADVIERSKFDKAIAEIKDNTFEHIVFEGGYDENEGVIRPKETTEVIRLDTLLQIFESNIGE